MVRLPPRLRPLFPYLKPAYVAGTRLVAPVTQRLGRDALPASVALTMEDAAAGGGRCVTARPAEVLERPRMLGRPVGLPLSDPSDGEHVGRVAVLELPRGRVLGPHRAVITGDGALVHEISEYFGTRRPREHPVFLNPRPAPALDVAGRLGVLAARGDGNYYHFLFDVLPRLGVLAQSGLDPVDRWYVPTVTAFQRELLELFGIDTVVDATEHPHVRAETLVVPGPPAMTEQNPPWVVGFLRDRLLPQVDRGGPRRRLYVTRGTSANNRAVRNETAVRGLLTARGFEAIDPGALAVREQLAAFAAAEVIVAPHGAALANLAFASPGATVIELFPAGCLLPDYWRLACGVPGLRYRYLSALGPRRPRAAAIVRDIDVDLAALDDLLDEALGLTPGS
jgi:Capsular polysaccharide biosynthesis protein